jgi:WD40 repeat protein
VVRRLEGHEDWVHTVAYSPNGIALATAGTDQRLIFWEADSGRQLCAFRDFTNALTRIAWSHDGTKLAVTGFAGALRIYDTAQRQLLRDLQAPCVDMRAVAFSVDDRLIASGGRNGVVRVWRTNQGEQLFEYKAHRQRIRAILFSPDGKQIVSCGEDRRIHVRSLEQKIGRDLPARPTKIFSMTFFGPRQLAYGGSDNLVRLWDLSTATEIGRLTGHQGSVAALDCDGEVLVSGGYDTSIHVWTIKDRVATSPGGTRALQ